MKTAENKTTASNTLQRKGAEPLFQKENGGQSFFSGVKNTATQEPFFKPSVVPKIQTKLKIGAPDDHYEREADSMADKVVQRLAESEGGKEGESPSAVNHAPSTVQRKCAACEQEEKLQKKEDEIEKAPEQLQMKPMFDSAAEPPPADASPFGGGEGGGISDGTGDEIRRKPIFESNQEELSPGGGQGGEIQRKCADCEQDGEIQRESDASTASEASPDVASRLSASKGGGSPLPSDTRSNMEGAFGADFSNVRVHTGSEAAGMSKDLHAQAFTHGSDIYFNEGKYSPGSSDGQKLLAHELTHTVQQGQKVSRTKIQKTPNITSSSSLKSLRVKEPYKIQDIELSGGEFVYLVLDLSPDAKIVQLPIPYAHAGKPFEIPASKLELVSSYTIEPKSLKASKQVYASETKNQFVKRVFEKAIERVTENIQNLDAWKIYLNSQFDDLIALRAQIRGTMAQHYLNEVVSGRESYFERWCDSRMVNSREVDLRAATGKINSGCQYCHENNYARQKDFEMLDQFGLKDFSSFQTPGEMLKEDALYMNDWWKKKNLSSSTGSFGQPTSGKLITKEQVAAIVSFVSGISANASQNKDKTAGLNQNNQSSSADASSSNFGAPLARPNPPSSAVLAAEESVFCPKKQNSQPIARPAINSLMLGPCTRDVFKALETIRPQLEPLGPWPRGYGVLPETIFSELYKETPEKIKEIVMLSIEERQQKYISFISRINNGDVHYLDLCRILDELWPTTNQTVRALVIFEKAQRDADRIVLDILIAALTLLSIIFPPMALVAGPLMIGRGYLDFQKGKNYGLGTGAGVYSIEQEAQAGSLQMSGIMDMFFGVVSTAAGLKGIKSGAGSTSSSAQQNAITLRSNVLRNTLNQQQLAQVQQVEAQLTTITQRAIQNVNNGTATGRWAQRLATTPQNNPMYRTWLGNAIHEEAFTLIQREVAAGNLPAGMVTNAGKAIPQNGLTNSFAGSRPDIRMPLGGGREAVFDITTVGQAGHAAPYGNFGHVDYVSEILY